MTRGLFVLHEKQFVTFHHGFLPKVLKELHRRAVPGPLLPSQDPAGEIFPVPLLRLRSGQALTEDRTLLINLTTRTFSQFVRARLDFSPSTTPLLSTS
jgi:hypothetical protein